MREDELRIRPFEEADRAPVASLWNTVFPDDPPRNAPEAVIGRKLRVQRELFLVAELGAVPVGTVIGGYDGYRGWIYHLAVAPEWRRRGIGRRLVGEAEAGLRALRCPKVNLQVRSENAAVLAFYAALGYRQEPRVSFGKLLETQE